MSLASRWASASESPRRYATTKAAVKASPAPTVSTTTASPAGCGITASAVTTSLPFGPFGPDYYTLLESALDHLATAPFGPSWLLSHEARWLHALGLLPDPGSPTLSLSPPARAILSAFLTPSASLPPSLPKPLYTELDTLLTTLLPLTCDSDPRLLSARRILLSLF